MRSFFRTYQSPRNGQSGFGMIELMFAILIIGLLAVVGISVYNGAKNKAKYSASKQALRTAVQTARNYYYANNDYSSVSNANITALESSLSFITFAGASAPGSSSSPKDIHWQQACSGQCLVVCSASKADKSFCILDNIGVDGKLYYRTATGNINAAFNASNASSW